MKLYGTLSGQRSVGGAVNIRITKKDSSWSRKYIRENV